MLRRDRRRAQAAVAAAVVQTVEAAATSPMAEAAAEAAQAPDDAVVAPVEAIAEEPVAAAEAAASDEPAASDTADAPDAEPAASDDSSGDHVTAESVSAEPAASASSGRARPAAGPRRRPANTATPSARTAPSARPARSPRTSGRRRIWQMTGAALAVATLVGGTALPALGMVRGETTPVTTSASADLRTQSFTASADVLPDVVVSGEFSATTPDELKTIQAVAAATARSGIAPIANPGQIIVPMAAGTYTMTDGFGASRPGRSHMGQDYAAPIGTPIYAAADGVVTMSQDSYGGYGVTVQVQHDDDGSVTTLYGHMNYGTRAVQPGEHVVAGQFLGRVGNTGYTIGSCLHFEVRINGTQINPVPWLDSHVR
jgi:murein DD-endopeptidase MepM/ murein hydrolase activator NlpD